MNLIQRVEHWGDTHHPRWMDIVRIALGIFLVYKGIEFLGNMSSNMGLMEGWMSFGSFTLLLIGHYIVFAHIVGGFLLAIGVLTRFACLLQIPILLGAIIFANFSGMWNPFAQWFITLLTLLLLIYFLVVGNGPWAIDLFGDKKKETV